jgi:2-hydroxy-3-keto-5-methylthiopentenyl-1-phosphate phosphatase
VRGSPASTGPSAVGLPMMGQPFRPLRVSLDFDGTLVGPNVAKLLMTEFVPKGNELSEMIDIGLHSGQLTLREAWARETALLPWDRLGEMCAFVRNHVRLRPGAREFLALARKHALPVSVVSGGLDFYIYEVLERERLYLPVRADRLLLTGDGRVRITYPHGHRSCRQCGTCKAGIVTEGFGDSTTVLIADGSTDRFAAEVADVVFARGRLLEYCRATGIPCYEFEDFGPVTEQFQRWLTNDEALPRSVRRGRPGSPCPISEALAWNRDSHPRSPLVRPESPPVVPPEAPMVVGRFGRSPARRSDARTSRSRSTLRPAPREVPG